MSNVGESPILIRMKMLPMKKKANHGVVYDTDALAPLAPSRRWAIIMYPCRTNISIFTYRTVILISYDSEHDPHNQAAS